MIQSEEELEAWYQQSDPWAYEGNDADINRRAVLLSEIPSRTYSKTLDIGCGEGFVTRELPGESVLGIDISKKAIERALIASQNQANLDFKALSLFDIPTKLKQKFDLVVITGVLYEQYIGDSSCLVNLIIDDVLNEGGILVSVHIKEWYQARFPYLMLKRLTYDYREYTHLLEVFVK